MMNGIISPAGLKEFLDETDFLRKEIAPSDPAY